MHESVGRSQTLTCALDPARAAALHATLDRPGPPPGAGDPLPPFWHQIYFWEARRPADLGPDGHPATGTGLIPDLGLPQRMWAGGRLAFHAAPRLGAPAEKTTTIENVTEKSGRTGRLGFVTLRHEITQDGRLCVTEHQDLVYREPPEDRTPVAPPQAPTDELHSQTITFTTTLLFRYSALTFNGHRIHYDLDYATGTEGYAGLVTHGPLLAQLLIHFAEKHLGPLAGFTFRGTAPLMHFESATLCLGRENRLWVRAADGRQCMEATATPA
ncbi:MaoC family dehydratase N-terminal domain-containing protein [Pseudoruegeria sp. HB172150]|uniref:MaoC family dehydratase N-terminal domain-containing protein n=1 Tax=Pseudoruegeria sp. HB172150 TaxID=2721164 RepID=UPI001557783D|nr:MaoC family dehydratase N-terminal domain-containing protein [Pseudoruegeria sp. HB172150]